VRSLRSAIWHIRTRCQCDHTISNCQHQICLTTNHATQQHQTPNSRMHNAPAPPTPPTPPTAPPPNSHPHPTPARTEEHPLCPRPSNISPPVRGYSTQIAEVLRTYPVLTVDIEGHTDPRASDAYNIALGQRRAFQHETT
jgi:hypothetical protein